MTTAPLSSNSPAPETDLGPADILSTAQSLRWEIGQDYHERLMEAIYTDASNIADRAVTRPGDKLRFDMDRTIDKIVTSRIWGLPLMVLMLAIVFWLTISGANVPSQMLATLLLDTLHPILKGFAATIGMPWWLDGFLLDGVYLATALGNQRDAAPNGDFLPAVYLARRFWLSPKSSLQHGQDVPPRGRPRQTSSYDGNGFRL